MSCTVTKTDIQNRIKNQIADEFESIRFTKFQDRLAGFIPYNASNPSRNVLYGKVKRVESQVNKEYNAGQFGKVVSFVQMRDGVEFNIHPTTKLATAMTLQNQEDEIGNDVYTPEQTEFFSQHEPQPVTDNFIEYKKYKEGQLEKTKAVLKDLNQKRRKPGADVSNLLTQISRLNTIEAKLKNDIEILNTNSVDLMFHAVFTDIQDLDKILDNFNYTDNKYDVDDLKNRIEFLHKLIKGTDLNNQLTHQPSLRDYNHAGFDQINRAVDNLNTKYKEKLFALKDIILSEDITYVNNVLGNEDLSEADIKTMFEDKNDITWMEKTFLGITSSSTDDSVLPQVLKSFLETKVALREAEVKGYKDQLGSLMNKLDDFDFIFEKSSKGNNTGNIINLISPAFNKALYQYMNIGKNDSEATPESNYKERVAWLRSNADVIDIRKLSAVREIYAPMYASEFTFSDQEIAEYEKELQDTLGPLYEEEIKRVLNNLENFQLQKQALLEDDTNAFRFRNTARIDPWAFVKHFYSPNSDEQIPYTSGSSNTDFVWSNIENIRFIPKTQLYRGFDLDTNSNVYENSGYYNEDFKEIQNDPNKLAYWKLMKEVYSNYVNPTYNTAEMSYAKVENEFLEVIASSKGILKGQAILKEGAHSFKSLFYEQGREMDIEGIAQNYSDKTRKVIGQYTQVFRHLSEAELMQIAAQEGITVHGLSKPEAIKEIATKKALKGFSTDINKVTLALLDMAALQKAKQDTLPIANLILDAHKMVKNLKGEERERSVGRMEDWINRVIKGENEKYRGSTNILGKSLSKRSWLSAMLDKMGEIPWLAKYVDQKKAFLMTKSEKELLKYLEGLLTSGANKNIDHSFVYNEVKYTMKQQSDPTTGERLAPKFYETLGDQTQEITEKQFDDAFALDVQLKIEDLGLDLSTAGIIQGILKTIILKGLGLNPISGIFNRIEGKNSGLVMDQTGYYWTKGNIHAANNFMAFANFIKFLPERFTPEQSKKVQELEKMQILLHNLNLIQDRKNELERHADQSKFDYEKYTNIYQFAVDNPEFKNQGAILLSVLMDTKIKDIDGNEYPIFSGKEFEVYNNVDGKLVLKDQFRTPENISNWEDYKVDETNLRNNQYLLTKNKIKQSISRSQGNYDNLDIIGATKNIWGRSLTLFMKWLPEHFQQRFSLGKGYDTVTGKQKLKGRYISLYQNNPALLTTGVISLFTGFGLTPITGLVGLGFSGFVAVKYMRDTFDKNSVQREVNNTQEFIDFAKSMVISTLNYPLEFFNSPRTITDTSYQNSNLTPEEVGNLQSVARELGMKLTFIAFLLLAKRLTWDDDDDPKSKDRMFHNFIDNQMTRMITSLSNWTNPEALASDVQRLAFLKYLWDVGKLLSSIADLNTKKIPENLAKASPLPRILTRTEAPWYDEKDYNPSTWMDKLVKSGESKAEYKEYKDNIKEEVTKELEALELTPAEFQKEFKKRVRERTLSKPKDVTYKEVLARIEAGETPKEFKATRKSSKKQRDARVDELKNEGYEDSEIYAIMRSEFDSNPDD